MFGIFDLRFGAYLKIGACDLGFTLVEALVAVAVLTVALTPVFAQVTASFRLARTIEQNLVASTLAQEGVELVRGMRDDNWFADNRFKQGFDACANGCRVVFDDSAPLPLDANPPLQVDTQGRYRYSGGTDTPYSRRVTIEDVSDGHVKVVSKVTWNIGGTVREVVVEDHLFDWLNI